MTIKKWREAVAEGRTLMGYQQWCEYEREANENWRLT